MTRTGQAAINYARSRIGPNSMPASGYCLQFVRQCFDVGSYYASAIDAWNAAQYRHDGDRNPPPATPVYFRSPSIYDHVAFFVSPTEVISTFNADVRAFNGIAGIEANFSGQFLGWAEDINRVRIYTPSTPVEEDVPLSQSDLEAIDRIVANRIDERVRQGGAWGAAITQSSLEAIDRVVAGQIDRRIRPTGDGDGTTGVALSDQARADIAAILKGES